MVRGSLVVVVTLAAATAAAQPRPAVPPLEGATRVVEIAPPAGFVDDAIGGDDQHLVYAVSDAATKAELHVLALDTKQEVVVDLAKVMLHPVGVPLFQRGRAFVIGEGEDGSQLGAMIDVSAGAKKPILWTVGPASHVAVISDERGVQRIALHRTTPRDGGTRHQVELYDLATGRRIATGRPLDLDASNTEKKLELEVNHWADGMTHAIGIKGGEWNKQEDQRSPDTEATYDLVTNRFVAKRPIEDLFEQRKRFQLLATAGGQLDFVHMTWDNQAVQLWRDGKPKPLDLDQPLASYDPKSLQGVITRDQVWIALQIDPVNPAAVARKKADPEYLDIFQVSGDKAVRKARVLAAGVHDRFGVLHDRFWLLQRSPSFDRGGKVLAVYQLQ